MRRCAHILLNCSIESEIKLLNCSVMLSLNYQVSTFLVKILSLKKNVRKETPPMEFGS